MKTLLMFVFTTGLSFAADISGNWTFDVSLAAGSGRAAFDFKQAGDKLTGTYRGRFGEAPLTGTIKLNKVNFSFGDDTRTARYAGTVLAPNKISGTVDYSGSKGTFTGTRVERNQSLSESKAKSNRTN